MCFFAWVRVGVRVFGWVGGWLLHRTVVANVPVSSTTHLIKILVRLLSEVLEKESQEQSVAGA